MTGEPVRAQRVTGPGVTGPRVTGPPSVRLCLLALGLAVLVTAGACDSDDDGVEAGGGEARTLGNPAVEGDWYRFEVTVEPDPAVAGADATWTLEIANTSEEAVELTFSSSQRGDVTLLQDGEAAWRWSDEMAFTQALEEVEIVAGERETFELAGTVDAAPGTYDVVVELTASPRVARIRGEIDVVEGD